MACSAGRTKYFSKNKIGLDELIFCFVTEKVQGTLGFEPRAYRTAADCSTTELYPQLRRPGIEPESQEWESCMIPLHQRRCCLKDILTLLCCLIFCVKIAVKFYDKKLFLHLQKCEIFCILHIQIRCQHTPPRKGKKDDLLCRQSML